MFVCREKSSGEAEFDCRAGFTGDLWSNLKWVKRDRSALAGSVTG